MTRPPAGSRSSRIGESLSPSRIFLRSFSTKKLLTPASGRPEARKMSFDLKEVTGARRRRATYLAAVLAGNSSVR